MAARRRRHPVRTAVSGVLALTVAAVLAGALAWHLTPTVADAPQRVAAAAAGRGETGTGGAVPAKVAAALVATEDAQFYSDPGIDLKAVLRRARDTVTGGIGGGAGLAQQLAKMLYTPGRTGIRAEVEQLTLAVKLDHTFSRTTVLTLYLDQAYFGDGAFGITDAARHYFGVGPDRLSWSQAALLAGLVQAPSSYDPRGHLALARTRELHVLDRLVATGTLTRAQAVAAWRSPLHPAVRFYG